MILSTKDRCALRLAAALAAGDTLAALDALAREQQTTAAELNEILAQLHAAGLTQPLAEGGWRLTRAPEQCPVGEILAVTKGAPSVEACVQCDGSCGCAGKCPVPKEWKEMDEMFAAYLKNTTLADLRGSL